MLFGEKSAEGASARRTTDASAAAGCRRPDTAAAESIARRYAFLTSQPGVH